MILIFGNASKISRDFSVSKVQNRFKKYLPKDLKRGVLSRSGKMLSTFEFWLELNRRCKGKTLPGVVNKLFFSVQYKTHTKQNMVFSVALLNGCKNSTFFTLPDLDKIQPRPF